MLKVPDQQYVDLINGTNFPGYTGGYNFNGR